MSSQTSEWGVKNCTGIGQTLKHQSASSSSTFRQHFILLLNAYQTKYYYQYSSRDKNGTDLLCFYNVVLDYIAASDNPEPKDVAFYDNLLEGFLLVLLLSKILWF